MPPFLWCGTGQWQREPCSIRVVWPGARNCAIAATTWRATWTQTRSGTGTVYSQKQPILTGVVLAADSREKRKQTMCPFIYFTKTTVTHTHKHKVHLLLCFKKQKKKENWFTNCSVTRTHCPCLCVCVCFCVHVAYVLCECVMWCVLLIGEPISKYN